jgi:predicted esterase
MDITRLIAIISIGIFANACNSDVQLEKNNKSIVFLSEGFTNRVIDDGRQQKHDSDCVGFYSDHFDPELIKSIDQNILTTNKLKELTNIQWHNTSPFDSVFDFASLISKPENKVVYLLELQVNPKQKKQILSLGSDDGLMVWHNGQKIYEIHKGRSTHPDDGFAMVSLTQGINTFLYKIDQGDGGWSLYRRMQDSIHVQKVIKRNAYDIYSDLPEKCIFKETDEQLEFKIDNRAQYDKYNSIILSFICEHKRVSHRYQCDSLPQYVDLPDFFNEGLLLHTKVIDDSNIVIFTETIPLFREAFINRILERLPNAGNQLSVLQNARLSGLKELFNHKFVKTKFKYSTRMQAHGLADWLNAINDKTISGPVTMAYRSIVDQTVQPYRVFLPERRPNTEASKPLIYIFHGYYESNRQYNFWQSYEGYSHSLLAKRAALATANNQILIMPFGRGDLNYGGVAKEEIAIINAMLNGQLNINSEQTGAIVWSKGSIPVLNLLSSTEMPFKTVALISPVVPDDQYTIINALQGIKKYNPEVQFYVRHGIDDNDVPIYKTREFVELLEKCTLNIDYKEIPFSSHWNYLVDPEVEFYKYINAL